MDTFKQWPKELAHPTTVGLQIHLPVLPVIESVAMKTAKLIEQGGRTTNCGQNHHHLPLCRTIAPEA
jgi:hypothetical protein